MHCLVGCWRLLHGASRWAWPCRAGSLLRGGGTPPVCRQGRCSAVWAGQLTADIAVLSGVIVDLVARDAASR